MVAFHLSKNLVSHDGYRPAEFRHPAPQRGEELTRRRARGSGVAAGFKRAFIHEVHRLSWFQLHFTSATMAARLGSVSGSTVMRLGSVCSDLSGSAALMMVCTLAPTFDSSGTVPT